MPATASRSSRGSGDPAVHGHVRLRRRVRPRPLPDPGEPEDRGRLGPPHPHGRQGRCAGSTSCSTRARSAAPGTPAAARRGTCARMRCDRPAGPAPTRRPADPARARPLRRGAAGAIAHALRFTTDRTRTSYIYPARHQAGESARRRCRRWACGSGSRRLYDVARFSPQARVIAVALQRYGMILADNGSPWYITGASDPASTTTSCTSSTSSPAATSRSSTRAGWSTGRSPRRAASTTGRGERVIIRT